ncbi:hypothetical protein OESDEN_15092 [Oesophagostomum dentatum]|uniref:Uncharacterized protein n=1 Tax=Oesophagostomum dentatum TaxID=61180 RepID=A0A0B1SMU5_OESDE|nr:hypothetical protein OESDEN_15092 [Oesophagostomum dentatum]
MNLTESLADKTKCQLINRLPYKSSPSDLEAWQDVANTLAFTYERILQLPSASFWSSVVFNKTIMQSFDAVLEAIPRRFEVDEYRLIFGWDASVAMAANRLRNSALAMFLRVTVYNKKLDPSMPQKLYLECVRDRDITRKRGLIDPSFSNDVTKICTEMEKMIPKLRNDATRLIDEFYPREGVARVRAAQLIDDWLCTVLAVCQEGCALLDTLSQAKLLKDPSRFIAGVPALIECVSKSFTTELIMDVAMTLCDYPLR